MSSPPLDPNDPYSTAGLKDQLVQEIENCIQQLKEHPGDMTQIMNKIFGDMQKVQGLLVGQSSETQSGLTTAITGIANLQKYGADKDGTPVQDINIFTGKPEVNADGSAKMVSPEQAFKDESMFLINSPDTKDKLDSNGKRIPAVGQDGKPIVDKNGNPVYLENPLYKFSHTQGNESVAAQLKSAVEGAVGSLSSNGFPASVSGDSGYVVGADGQVAVGADGYPTGACETVSVQGSADKPDKNGNYKAGAISNMWKLSEQTPTPDSSVLNNFQSAMGTLGQAGTASSSTLQAFIKVLTDNFTASQGNYNKALSATIDMLKVFVQAQKTG